MVNCFHFGKKKKPYLQEQLHFHFSLSCVGEGNGNPLQCSCLENPGEGGVWWAAISGVAQSWTRLKWLSSSSSSRANLKCLYILTEGLLSFTKWEWVSQINCKQDPKEIKPYWLREYFHLSVIYFHPAGFFYSSTTASVYLNTLLQLQSAAEEHEILWVITSSGITDT